MYDQPNGIALNLQTALDLSPCTQVLDQEVATFTTDMARGLIIGGVITGFVYATMAAYNAWVKTITSTTNQHNDSNLLTELPNPHI